MSKPYSISYTEIIRMNYNGNLSPDGKWKIIIEDNQVKWVELTVPKDQYTIQELVEATKRILPEIW